MKSASVLKFFATALMLALIGIGCQKKPHTGITHIPGQRTPPPDSSIPSGLMAGQRTPDPGVRLPTDADPSAMAITANPDGTFPFGDERESRDNFWVDRDIFAEETLYFAFDRSEINPAERPKIERVATYLRSNPEYQLEIEGHCDERGTAEYNRALGERRALAVREALIAMGIAPERIGTISFGEDKPAVLGFDEWAYSQNRRAEFVLLRPRNN
jgi:peptidoglycan-associated lipoprotein